ncbi:NMDA receptor synaptonuclear signaling and neuronal migration factor isoform X2 [Nematolebias whitei]|uniref:NMDA receptor synaptonuclear signaling and neuronal migration factor isoform X2 n=1 Tax=Nematolebias whitei TaxID=451745 RepID=UPI0018971929|nr:NMDA receptor synaptonuclear signaling and neuronal migration factor isoform X2 [Nematolebias whitei]
MGTTVSKRKNLRNDAISSVAAKVRAARAFGEYLSHTHPENRNGSAHLLCESLVGPDPESPSDTIGPNSNDHFNPCSATKSYKTKQELAKEKLGFIHPPSKSVTISTKSTGLPLESSFTAEEDQKKTIECALQPARVYTITAQRVMLMSSSQDSKESLELDVLKEKSGSGGSRGGSVQPSTSPSSASSSPTQHNRSSSGRGANNCSGGHHHRCNHHHGIHHYHNATLTNAPSSSGGISGASGSSSSNQVQPQIPVAGSHSHHAMHHHAHHHHNLSQPPLQTSVSAQNIRSLGESGKGEAEYRGLACEACSGAPSRSQGSLDLESTSRDAGKQHRRLERMWSVDRVTGLEREDTNWFPKENLFTFQTATTTMQAISNFRKHLRMVGSRRIKAQSGDLQTSSSTLEEGGPDEAADWEEEKEMERLACEGDDFVPPKIMLISSKVPKAEYVPTIIRRDDPSIIPILYDHEHATFDDILEEIDKKLTAYRRGSKFWRMLIFCQGGPGHLYLLKNKVATFAKVEKEEDMSQFWKRLSRFMSKINPEPNVIHIMGCYVLGNPNGEKLFQKLKNLMRPYSVEFESPLELSAQGKEMIEMYFDFRLYRLWKTRQHSKLLDYEDFL